MRIGIISFLICYILVIACNKQATNEYTPPTDSDLTGEQLAKLHCGSCHSFPEPSALPKSTWLKSVLPKMGLRLGIGDNMLELMSYSNEEMLNVMNGSIYPEHPQITDNDWKKIVSYYELNAPETLKENSIKITEELSSFSSEVISNTDDIVMTEYDPINKQLNIGTEANTMFQIDNFNKISSPSFANSPVVDTKNHKILGKINLEVGKLNPNDLTRGVLKAGNKVLIDKLQRPVNLLIADVNEDNYEDFLICNFGNHLGKFSIYDGKTFKENVLVNNPGARISYFVDFDKDGKKDILVLMTQGRESILFFKNLGKGNFEMKTLLSFPPYYGSSYFELLDIDKDNDLDIVYTNGDNADLSIVLKPYHGLHVYVNEGDFKFKEKYFYPINGASKVLNADYDFDGDLDFSVISFAPDLNKKEGFLFFENKGNLEFNVQSKKNISNRKWLTMEKGDFDNDGDLDLVLGAFREDKNKFKNSLFYLKNNIKK